MLSIHTTQPRLILVCSPHKTTHQHVIAGEAFGCRVRLVLEALQGACFLQDVKGISPNVIHLDVFIHQLPQVGCNLPGLVFCPGYSRLWFPLKVGSNDTLHVAYLQLQKICQMLHIQRAAGADLLTCGVLEMGTDDSPCAKLGLLAIIVRTRSANPIQRGSGTST